MAKKKAVKDKSLIIKYDGINDEESRKLLYENQKAKSEIAPDSRASFVSGKTKELPLEERKLLEEKKDATKKKQ